MPEVEGHEGVPLAVLAGLVPTAAAELVQRPGDEVLAVLRLPEAVKVEPLRFRGVDDSGAEVGVRVRSFRGRGRRGLPPLLR